MERESKITIFSTFAHDTLSRENGVIIGRQNGGPAFYIKKIFENEGTPFTLRSGPKMEVQVLITKDGEFGKITKKPVPRNVRFSMVRTPLLLVSTLLNEFDLAYLPAFKGKVFLDVQGYVRDGDDFGKKKIWIPSEEIFANIFCVKGTKEEIQNMPDQYVEVQKQKMLLITKDKLGCEAYAFGKRYTVKPTKVIVSKDTLGAGDTFFAYFISRFVKKANVLDSVRYAVERTSIFLSARNVHHHN